VLLLLALNSYASVSDCYLHSNLLGRVDGLQNIEPQPDASSGLIELAGIDEDIVQNLLQEVDLQAEPIPVHLLNELWLSTDSLVDFQLEVLLVDVGLEQASELLEELVRILDDVEHGFEFVLFNERLI